MGNLKLKFIETPPTSYRHPLEAMLHKYGEEISNYAKTYFSYLVTLSSYNEEVQSASLYIIVPEIVVDYQIITIRIRNKETVDLHFFTLKTKQVENEEIKVNALNNDFTAVEPIVIKHLESGLAQQTFKFLVDQVNLKRKIKSETFEDKEE